MPVITNTLVSLETGAEIEVRDIASSEELASNDGAKLIGSCASIAELRTVSGTYDQQRIHVTSYYDTWAASLTSPVGGGYFRWISASTATDDGGSVFAVTGVSTGRWYREFKSEYVTLEDFGGSTSLSDNSTMLQQIFNGIADDKLSGLHLGAGSYNLASSVTSTCPVTIIGLGKINTISNGNNYSSFVDKRGANAVGSLIKLGGGSSTLGVNLKDFAIIGTESDHNVGLEFSCVGWQGTVRSIRVQGFRKQGIYFTNHLNDFLFDDIQILSCGGKKDGVVYYALDCNTGLSSSDSGMNQIIWNKLHIEYSRYCMNIRSWWCSFNDCHFEIGNASEITSIDDASSHWINIDKVNLPLVFSKCRFVGPTFDELTSGLSNTTNPASILTSFASVIGSSVTSLDGLSAGYTCKVQLDHCCFTSANGPFLKVLELPFHHLSMNHCQIYHAYASSLTYPVSCGQKMKLSDNDFIMRSKSGDTSVFSSYMNNSTGNCINSSLQSNIHNNLFVHANASVLSLAVIAIIGDISTLTNPTEISGNTLIGFSSVSNRTVTNTTSIDTNNSTRTLSSSTSGTIIDTISSSTGIAQRRLSYGSTTITEEASASNGMQKRFSSTIGKKYDTGSSLWREYPLVDQAGSLGKLGQAYGFGYFGNWVIQSASITPTTAGGAAIGSSSLPVSNVYSQSALTIVSDKNLKQDISSIPNELIDAIGKLSPKLFRLRSQVSSKALNGVEARYHAGYIAQEVIESITSAGLDWTIYGLVTLDTVSLQVTTNQNGLYIPVDTENVIIDLDSNGCIIQNEDTDSVTIEDNGTAMFTRKIYNVRMEEIEAIKQAYILSKIQ